MTRTGCLEILGWTLFAVGVSLLALAIGLISVMWVGALLAAVALMVLGSVLIAGPSSTRDEQDPSTPIGPRV